MDNGVEYATPPKTSYQIYLRETQGDTVKNHVTKKKNPLVQARIEHIPTYPYADWRDLPNIPMKLSDGTTSEKLKYEFDDKKAGRGPNGELRGVCACASNGACEPSMRQVNTLIPWCLPHTGNRHGHWRGLYGRVLRDSHFVTIITSVEPMGKVGRVLHPTENRVCSVREWARAQGISDTFLFLGNSFHMYKSIGNAVPVPFAQVVGLEFKKAFIKDMENGEGNEENNDNEEN